MNATGWCEDCGDVEVEPLVLITLRPVFMVTADYADCPICGGDVDQWAWA